MLRRSRVSWRCTSFHVDHCSPSGKPSTIRLDLLPRHQTRRIRSSSRDHVGGATGLPTRQLIPSRKTAREGNRQSIDWPSRSLRGFRAAPMAKLSSRGVNAPQYRCRCGPVPAGRRVPRPGLASSTVDPWFHLVRRSVSRETDYGRLRVATEPDVARFG